MKKIICFVLALVTVCTLLVACGPGGDTNMHKIMHAIEKEEAIRASTYPDEADCYVYHSLDKAPYDNGWQNVNYDSTEAWADNVYYKHHIMFNADRIQIRQDAYKKEFDTKIYWDAKDNTISIGLYEAYSYQVWDSQRERFNSDKGFEVSSYDTVDAELFFDMNVYYEKGSFEVSDATYDAAKFTVRNPGEFSGCMDTFIGDMVDLLNDALDGLNGVYTAKGYPIK